MVKISNGSKGNLDHLIIPVLTKW